MPHVDQASLNAPTASELAAIELAALKAWPAPIVERVGDWWMRSAEGFTGRGNSALTLGDPGLPLSDAIERVAAFYRRLGERPMADVPHPVAAPVAQALTDAGWTPIAEALVQIAALPDLLRRTEAAGGAMPSRSAPAQPASSSASRSGSANAPSAGVPFADAPLAWPLAVELVSKPSDDHLAQIRESRSMLPEAAMHLLTGVAPVVFAECRIDGALVARGRGTVTDGRLGLYSIATVPQARGRGLATALVGRLAQWADENGASSAFLQVEAANATAIRLYEQLGFRTHHTYTRYAL